MSVGVAGSRPGIDPRIHDRRIAVARQQGRRRLRVVVGALGVMGAGAIAWAVLHSSFFSARHLTVHGAEHTSVGEILAVGGLSGHPPLVDVDAGSVSALLQRLPWVAVATVHKRWPDSLTIDVRERSALAAIRVGRRFALVDTTGRVLEYDPAPPSGLPLLVAPHGSAAPGRPGTDLDTVVRPGLVVASAVPRELRQRIHTVSVTSGGIVSLDLGAGLDVLVGGDDELQQKFESLESLLVAVNLTGPAQVDLTVPDEPVVTPSSVGSGSHPA